MKKTILLGITAAGAAILLASCSDDWGMKSEGRGSIAPLVDVDTQAITSQKSSDSRADGDAVAAADLSIRLTKSDGSWSNTWEKLADFDVTQQFAVGDNNKQPAARFAQRVACMKKPKGASLLRLRVSKKWLRPLFRVEVLHFLLSAKADGRKKCKEWFRLMPKPPRPRGKAPRYEYSQRACGPSDTSHGGFLTV